jgi:folate-dependent phosphoribosylglycinamide formyltransferase PurN
MEQLAGLSPDVSIGAGYMLLAPVLCRHYTMINLHPSLPDGPAGTWQQVIWELMEGRATESGVMVHIMVPEMDAGPVLTYCRYGLEGPGFDDGWADLERRSVRGIRDEEGEYHQLFKSIRSANLARERPFLVETLKAMARGRVNIQQTGRVPPLDLTTEVDAVINRRG